MMFSEVDLSFGTYPWAQVGMEIIRLIGRLFEFLHVFTSTFVDPLTFATTTYDHDGPTRNPTKAGAFSYQSWWGRIQEKNWFERIFCCTFMIFDALFEKHEKANLLGGNGNNNNNKRRNMSDDMWDSINVTLTQTRIVLLRILNETNSIDEIEACAARFLTELKLNG